MAKMKNKKGIFFTFIAISIMILFTLIFTPQADISLRKDTRAIKARIGNINSYVDDLEYRYFETVLRATTYKTILSLIYYINSTQQFLDNLDSAFYEVALNGTINGYNIDLITGKKIMYENNLTYWSDKIAETARQTLNVNTTIHISNVSINQTTPWSIDARLSLDITVISSVAIWKKTNITILTSIDIHGLHDPYYLVNTNGQYSYRINKSEIEFNKWNISNVRDHINNETYVHWQNSQAPSFLMRFTNTIERSLCCGIESLVNPNRISPSANNVNESYVDYIFWSPEIETRCEELYNLTNPQTGGGLWDEFMYFKLDLNHTILYNITDNDAVGNCR
ncbi:hypothetical protein HYW99_00135 [Candidatus Woesearchaeota archaeon]|nr:hypothetical protein [Candidatus Woesearchaeota archaeon]